MFSPVFGVCRRLKFFLMFLFFPCSKMSELESNPPDEEKKPISSYYDATSFHLNGDYFENQVINIWSPLLCLISENDQSIISHIAKWTGEEHRGTLLCWMQR